MKIDSEEEAIFIAERKEWGVRSVSKLKGLPARRHKANRFRASEPRPYELNGSIIHVLTHYALLRSSMYYQYFEIV